MHEILLRSFMRALVLLGCKLNFSTVLIIRQSNLKVSTVISLRFGPVSV